MANIEAVHLNTGTRVSADTITQLCELTGISRKSFTAAGQPSVYQGWAITIHQRLHEKSPLRDQATHAKRRHAVVATSVVDPTEVYTFESINDAAAALNSDNSVISKVLRGLRTSAAGYRFEYRDGQPQDNRQGPRSGTVIVLEKEGQQWRFTSATQAAIHLGCNVESLRRNIRQGARTFMSHSLRVVGRDDQLAFFLKNVLYYLRNRKDYPDSRRWNKVDMALLKEWAARPDFLAIWEEYVDSGMPRELQPSLDRKDPGLGYTSDNIQWISLSKNFDKTHADIVYLREHYRFYISNQSAEEYATYSEALRQFKRLGYPKIEPEHRPHIACRKLPSVQGIESTQRQGAYESA